MSNTVSIYDAKTNLSKYIKQAKAGTPVYIGSYGTQEVVLMAAEPKKTQITFGTAKGKLAYMNKQHGDLDADVQEMFYGKDWDKS
ncbi:MAG TPA: type II toxin-antitoxin system prevent-host-death family antitoxin [Candidatus Dormibacteraeota bacterium]|nr:type II toxin-antitoxin system prevent-host-death family antitoxin [Candidatus Dormibacteraeota bacterium]